MVNQDHLKVDDSNADNAHPPGIATYWQEVFEEQTNEIENDEDKKTPADTHTEQKDDEKDEANKGNYRLYGMTGEVARQPGAFSVSSESTEAVAIKESTPAAAGNIGSRAISADVRRFWQDEFHNQSLNGKDGANFTTSSSRLKKGGELTGEEKTEPTHLGTITSQQFSLGSNDSGSRAFNDGSKEKTNLEVQESQSSQPGAYAQEGPGETADDQRSSAVDEVLASIAAQENEPNCEQARGIEAPHPNRTSSVASLVKADMVNDAEAIFYAEDVQHDRFKRNMAWGILLLSFAVLGVVLMILLIDRDEEPRTGDPLCWPPVAEQSVFVRCFCSNSTGNLYDDLTETGLQVYQDQINLLQIAGLWEYLGYDEIFDVYSCDETNQVTLNVAAHEAWGANIGSANAPLESMLTAGILMVVYALMDGIHWHQSDLWNEDIQLCNWFGVGCLFNEVFHELKLPQNGLVGELPYEFAEARNLRVLDLSSNDITGTIPTDFGMISLLNSLTLSNLYLTGTIPTELLALDRLGVLDVGQNMLSGTLPVNLFQMTALRELALDRNFFSGTLPGAIKMASPQLSVLRLDNNRLFGQLPAQLATLSNLEVLTLGNNTFSGSIPDFLGEMPRLQFLAIEDSGLTGPIPETFCSNGRLSSRITKVCGASTEDCSCCRRDSSMFAKVHIRCVEDTPDYG